MNVLIIGSGGREHALAWKIAQSPLAEKVYCVPGNPGIQRLKKGQCAGLNIKDFAAVSRFISENGVGLTVVGPEDPLAAGITDTLRKEGHAVFGPVAAAAQLESSKAFAKAFMKRQGIPTAAYEEFNDPDAAIAYVKAHGAPIVIKADGLAAGKGVTVAQDVDTAVRAIQEAMVERIFGDAGSHVVIEECLVGEEASILAFCDGTTVVPMVSSQDHKAVYDGDQGPNTGGMGAYSPAPVVTPEMQTRIEREILQPVISGMAEAGSPYQGILYAGLMITSDGPKVIEFNVRFGDPETQVVLPRMKTDIVPVFLACCEGSLHTLTIEYDEAPCVTVVMTSGGYPKEYKKGMVITGIEEAESDPDIIVFHAGTKERDGALITNGGRVLNVTARGATLRETIDRAYNAVRKIHFEDVHFRNDIGHRALARG
ncbi:MAG TPA: phosphoribosylamine--glycine ligase [Candidatus Hydrogenedentes bacterium]|mgnify:CR=1 FL=1|nr:phosphoribosylamine--glycine ligase [Candidatus Hydrogenedentota bacterium]